MILKGLVGAACIAIIAFVGWYFYGQYQVAQARAADEAAVELPLEAAANCKALLANINSDGYNTLSQHVRDQVYGAYKRQCMGPAN